jgi:cytochrome c oxidase subunit III
MTSEPFLADHYETPQQQFAAGKLGMWIFLLTEILLFGGLFCAYAVYRANHPEIFVYAHQFLDKNLGAINTAVLIFSSLTMAWGVRCAQIDQQRGLAVCLTLTLVCACAFLSIKYVEYKSKWEEGLLWASQFKPNAEAAAALKRHEAHDGAAVKLPPHRSATAAPTAAGLQNVPRNVGVFFSIYFLMTGLHAIHVLAGMGAIGWILIRTLKGQFGSRYFAPVDYVGLYWHLVDMVWIYLFPLLYLIS